MKPVRAAVRPRFISDATGDALPLEDSVADLFRHFHHGVVEIAGPKGFGKTHALRHLAAVLPEGLNVSFADADEAVKSSSSDTGLVVAVEVDAPPLSNRIARFNLAPWGIDECIEYSLQQHPTFCKSVIQRLLTASDRNLLNGCPELCAITLDQMSAHSSIESVADALKVYFLSTVDYDVGHLPYPDVLLTSDEPGTHDKKGKTLPEPVRYVLRHRYFRFLAAALQIAEDMNRDGRFENQIRTATRIFSKRHEVVGLIASSLRDTGEWHMERALQRSTTHYLLQSLFASVLLHRNRSWRPQVAFPPRLQGAILNAALWSDIDLREIDLCTADLTNSQLSGALLNESQLRGTDFQSADLSNANLFGVHAEGAIFRDCDLRNVVASKGRFSVADFTNANAQGATFKEARLQEADLRNSCFRGAQMQDCDFTEAILHGADLAECDLRCAKLRRTDLRSVNIDAALLSGADLSGSNLEDVNLNGFNFRGALFHHSHLTGATLRRCDLHGARFRSAYLAEVDLSESDLRDASFAGATFHMGRLAADWSSATLPVRARGPGSIRMTTMITHSSGRKTFAPRI